ncbi:MAG: hypothetical protein A2Y07_07875 [Planctomycetes bacterium GWF2_50_10]|nr:MAG: hypothetical protein A2Y07_07875 [Planctomycetes bacterium GWF2_50_10]
MPKSIKRNKTRKPLQQGADEKPRSPRVIADPDEQVVKAQDRPRATNRRPYESGAEELKKNRKK